MEFWVADAMGWPYLWRGCVLRPVSLYAGRGALASERPAMRPLMELVTEWHVAVLLVWARNPETSIASCMAGERKACAEELEAWIREWAAEAGANDDGMWSGRDSNKFIEFHRDILGVSPPPEKESQG